MNFPKGDRYNSIGHIREQSTFENFEPQNNAMKDLVSWLQRLAWSIAEMVNKTEEFSLPSARLVGISGRTGLGKTHLSEAFIAEIQKNIKGENMSDWTRRNVMLCRDFNLHHANRFFDEYQIVVLDDLFSDEQSLAKVGDYHIGQLAAFIQQAYELRKLVIISSNFSLAEIAEQINKIDTIGRIKSRLAELLAGWKRDFPLSWEDYRPKLAEMHTKEWKDPFAL